MTNFFMLMITAFMTGILGGIHCVGMCGGIVCTLCFSFSKSNNTCWNPFLYQLCYNIGRIFTYTLLGAITGIIGIFIIRFIGPNSVFILRFITGISIILVGLYITGWWQLISYLEKIGIIIWKPVSKITHYFLPIKTMKSAFILGGLWGFLPCGLVYSTLFYSLSSNNWLIAAGIMFSFGLGTLPAMLLMGSAVRGYQQFLRHKWVNIVSGLTIILFGIISITWLFYHSGARHACANCH